MDDDEVERVQLLLSTKQFEQAGERIAKAVATDQNDDEAWALLSIMHMAQGQPRPALDAINRAIGANPDEGMHYSAKAMTCLELGDVGGAVEASGRGVALEPEDAWVQAVRAIVASVAAQQGLPGFDADLVMFCANRALELDDMSTPVVIAYAGMALLNIGQKVASARILEMGAARFPQAPELAAALGISRNPVRHAEAWRLLASANEMDSQALRITQLPIVGRAVRLVNGSLGIGGNVVLLALFSWFLNAHGMLAGWVRPWIGVVGALLVLPSLVSHAKMPRSTRRYLHDNVPHYRLAARGSLLTMLCALVASFGPSTWVLPAGALGVVAYTVALWATTRMRRFAIEQVPASLLAGQAFKSHDRMLVGVITLGVLLALLSWFGWHTLRTVLAMIVAVPVPLAVLALLAGIGMRARPVDFPGRRPIVAAVYFGNVGLISLAWGDNIWWAVASFVFWYGMLVLRGVARRRNAAAGAEWRIPTYDASA